jgi:hypothetical protein
MVPNRCRQQDEHAARDEDAERDHDVPADLDDRAVDHGGHGVRGDCEREVDDTRHQSFTRPAPKRKLSRRSGDSFMAAAPTRIAKQDERQHVSEAPAVIADEGAEEISRHEHLDDRHRRDFGLRRVLCDLLLRCASVFLEETCAGLRIHARRPARGHSS